MNPLDTRPDQLRDTRNIFTFAALLSAAFAGVGVIGQALGVVPYSLVPATVCGVIGVVLSGLGVRLAPRVRNLHALSRFILVGFVLTATAAIHFAGGPQSFLTALYIGITVGAAFLMGRRGAVGMAVLSAACFSILVGLEFLGLLRVYPIWDPNLTLQSKGAVLGGLIFSMIVPTLIVAYVTGTLADRLSRRTAEQAALGRIARDIAASFNQDEILHSVLQYAIRNTLSDRGCVYLYDAERQTLTAAATIGMGQLPGGSDVERLRRSVGGVVGRVLRSGRSARIDDVSRDPDYIEISPETRSKLCVPIVQNNLVQGVLNLEGNRPAAYTEAHQRFVEQLTQHAAIALFNARLYARTEGNLYQVARANLEIHALQESLSAVQSSLELDQVLQHICDAVVTLGYDLATLAILDLPAQRLAIRAVAAADQDVVHSLESILGIHMVGLRTRMRSHPRNIGARALADRKILVSSSTIDFLYPIASGGPRSQALETVGLRIGAAIPLVVRDQPLGILYVFSRKLELTDMDLSSLQAFGAQAAVALDKANLFEEARTTRDRLQAVLDATHDGLILYDTYARMVLTNRAAERLLSVPLTPYGGQPMASLLDGSGLIDRLYPGLNPAERQAAIDTEVNTMTAGLRDGSSEVARRLITVPGPETRHVEEFNLRVLDEHGHLAGRLVVLHDVTDQKRLESDRDAFTQMLVHDLRSPLSAIIGGLQLIELGIQENDPPDLLLKSGRVALASSNKLLSLISSLLDVQKLQAGLLELQLTSLAPASLIDDALETLRPLADMASVAFQVTAGRDLPVVEGDADHLRRVLINLADNALKFSEVESVVRVSAIREGDWVRFSVADDGPGIPADYRERVFERYVQVPGRTARRRGTGLGLTYCKMVVEMHGGKIWVEDTPGSGSTFTFTLPVASV